jgi:hypothetical protein
MNDKGNRYAICALKDRRATMAGEIIQMKEGIRHREEQLTHLDATLRVLDPTKFWHPHDGIAGATAKRKDTARIQAFWICIYLGRSAEFADCQGHKPEKS